MSDSGVTIVCFDLGGVVHRICRRWEEACARAGVPVREPERFEAPELAARRRALTDAYQIGRLACGDYWRAFADATGGLYAPAEIERVHAAWLIEDYPGVESLIARLAASPDILTACLSNTNHSHWQSLRSSPAVARIRRPLVSHEMGMAKPDPAIYAEAERSLGVAGDRIVFFDDLEENIRAARGRGWRAFVVDHAGDTAAQMTTTLASIGIGAA